MNPQASIFNRRRAGVLLHITSLPSRTVGLDAYRFIDFLHAAGMTVWQMLPLGPTHEDNSPYQCLSAHAANSDLICIETLKSQDWADFGEQDLDRQTILMQAFGQFESNASPEQKQAFADFRLQQADWLDDYVLFCQIRELNQNKPWFDWPEPLRDRDMESLAAFRIKHQQALSIKCFEQFQFFTQWHALKYYANTQGVLLFGDMPIFVAHDSADVWANSDLFMMDTLGQATKVAGVPPDYFSETGQRWGNPLYDWTKHEAQDYLWWQQRLATQLELFDLIRIDHFRGFEACWEIPASCETAIEGQWVKAPGEALFDKLVTVFGELPLVAEDLGIITDQVTALREKYGMPGMKILHFAFGGDADNPYLPHQHQQDSVAYTGTHDNDTTLGWYQTLDQHTKDHLAAYVGESSETMPWLLIRMAMQSVAELAIIPMQDIMELTGSHRMNVPGSTEGNWSWSFLWQDVIEDNTAKLKQLNQLYGRSE